MARRVVIRGATPETLEALRKALGQLPRNLSPAKEAAYDELAFSIEELNARLQRHLAEYTQGARTRGSVEWWMKREIRYFYRGAFIEGKRAGGHTGKLDEIDERELKRLRISEYRYLRNFLDDVDAGRGRMDYARRMRMYADALSGVFQLGFVRANRSNRRRIIWVRSPVDSCDTCIELDGRRWTPRAFLRWYRQTRVLPGKNTDCQCITTPYSRVTTSRGLVPIAEVQVGDLVWTHRNRWRQVTAVTVSVPGPHHQQAWVLGESGIWIGCTSDHRWWTADGWRDVVGIDNWQLSVYATLHGPTLRRMRQENTAKTEHRSLPGLPNAMCSLWSPDAEGSEVRPLHALRERMRLRNAEGPTGERVCILRAESQSQTAVAREPRWSLGGTAQGWDSASPSLRRLGSRIFRQCEIGRAALCVLLGRGGEEANDLPLSVALAAGARSYPPRHGYSPQERRLYGRPIGKPRTHLASPACSAPHDARPRSVDGQCPRTESSNPLAGVHVRELRNYVPRLSQRRQATPVLLGNLPPSGPLYDLTVEEDHSFVIEGLVCHNSNCKCRLEDRFV